MSDNKNNLNKKIGRFANILYSPDLPALYNQGLSDYEILVRLASVINNNADIMNDWYKIVLELEAIMNDVEDVVKEKVIEAIKKLYDSGELGQIIGNIISDSLLSKSGAIDLQFMGRVLRTGHNWKNYSDSNHDNTYDVEHFNYAQGGVVFEQDGYKYWAVAYVCNNGTHFRYSNNVDLVIYKFNAFDGIDYLTHMTYGNIGHANGVGYCDGYIYISPNSEAYDTGGSNFAMRLSTKLFRVKFENEVLDNATESWQITDIPDWQNNYVDGICSYDNTLYFFDGFGDIYSFDWESKTSTLEFNNVYGNNTAPATLSVDENFLYMGDFSGGSARISRYNKAMGCVDWTYQLPDKVNDKMYAIGEIENVTVLNGILYICGCYGLQRIESAYSIVRFYRQSLTTNKFSPVGVLGWSSSYNTYHQTYYVDGNYPSDTDSPKIVTGFSNNPFSCLPEAIEFICHNDWITHAEIHVKQLQHCVPVSIETNKGISIYGEYHQAGGANIPSLIGMLWIQNSPFVKIYDIGIRNMLPEDFPNSTMRQNCFYISGGSVVLTNPYMPTGNISNSVRVKNGIYCAGCFLSLLQASGVAVISTTDWENARSAEGVTNPAYLSSHECTVNTHGLVNTGGNIIG